MKTSTRTQEPALVLQGSSGWSNDAHDEEILWVDLINARIGAAWSASNGNCGRDAVRESAVVVYREDSFVVLRVVCERWADSPRGERSRDVELVCFDF